MSFSSEILINTTLSRNLNDNWLLAWLFDILGEFRGFWLVEILASKIRISLAGWCYTLTCIQFSFLHIFYEYLGLVVCSFKAYWRGWGGVHQAPNRCPSENSALFFNRLQVVKNKRVKFKNCQSTQLMRPSNHNRMCTVKKKNGNKCVWWKYTKYTFVQY